MNFSMRIHVILVPCRQCGEEVSPHDSANFLRYLLTGDLGRLLERPRHILPGFHCGNWCDGDPELALYLGDHPQAPAEAGGDARQELIVESAYQKLTGYFDGSREIPPRFLAAIDWARQVHLSYCLGCGEVVHPSNNFTHFLYLLRCEPGLLRHSGHHLLPVWQDGRMTCAGRPEIARYLRGQPRNPPGSDYFQVMLEYPFQAIHAGMGSYM